MRPSKDCPPALTPIPLAQDLIRGYSNPGDLAPDPFSGSGATACAALPLGRRAIWVDIRHPRIEAAIEQWLVDQPLFAGAGN